MITRVRPVLMTQLSFASGMLFDETKMLLNYYNNLDGNNKLTSPHPPSYYLYGAGGSAYYYPQNKELATANVLFTDLGMLPAEYTGKWGRSGFRPWLQADAKYVATLGLKRIAYEGGPHLETGVNVVDYAVTSAAVSDPRMTSTIVNMHNEWSSNNGDLLVYYRATGDAQWGFTPDIYKLNTAKLLAIDALNNSERPPVLLGTVTPGVVSGANADVCSRSWGCTPIQGHDYFTADGSKLLWASYLFRSSTSTPWTINLSIKNAGRNTSLAIYLDGKFIETKTVTDGVLSFKAGLVSPGLHSVLVKAVTGKFVLNTISVIHN